MIKMPQAHPMVTTLDNGFRVVTDSMKQVDSVSMSVWVKVGGRFETSENCGIAHFLEHMAFKGTESRTALEIAKAFDMIGGQFNAYTGKEATVYYAKVLKEHFSHALKIIADILLNSSFDSLEIEKERGVVLQEISQTEDSPDDILFDKYVETAYPDQALGRPILGTKELVTGFGREHLKSFINKNYHGDSMLLSVAGNVDHESVVRLSEECFSSVQKNSSLVSVEKARYQGGDFREKRELEQLHMVLGFEGFSFHCEDYYTAQVLSLILGGGMSSRLFQEVREKRGLAYSVSAFSNSYSDSGLFSICSGVEPGKVEQFLDVVFVELKKMRECITAEELLRAKSQIKSSLLMSMEGNSSRADIAGSSYLRYNRYVSKQEILEKINNITAKQLEKLMRSIFELCRPITVSAIGRVEVVPAYDDIVNKLF